MRDKLFKQIRSVIRIKPGEIAEASKEYIVKETYNSLRTKLLASDENVKCPIYVVTSPLQKDGKTFNCVNIALSFAEIGKQTLLLDANIRHPSIHSLFNLELYSGISEVLEGSVRNLNFHK
jgi:Mrp family chromosome partitioning ATPase